jgi:6-phosphogluconolactonase (cycloisomerase 2 family)
MPSRKVSMKNSLANRTSVLGIMGGLAKHRTGASGNRSTNKLTIPQSAAAGLTYMKMNGILSRNPQGSGGVGKTVKSLPCNCNGLEKTTAGLEKTTALETIPDIIIGSGYGAGTNVISTGNTFSADISNVSWMLQLDNSNILMNNELGTDGKSGELYIVDNSGIQKDHFHLMEKGLAGPVYFCKHDKKIYVACYGYWGNAISAGIFVFNQNDHMSKGKAHISPPPSDPSNNSHIHMIDIFTPTDTTVYPFLLAVDLGNKCIYKINPDEGVNFDTKVYSNFGDLSPRHFVQIPNTNYIALITEESDKHKATVSDSSNQTVVMILKYNGASNNFEKITTIDLGEEFINNKHILNGITGAEIKYVGEGVDGYIYVTVRGYKWPYKDYLTLPANGLFVKLQFKDNKLKLVNYVPVGQDPRYFTIDTNTSRAYVANHLSSDISIINIETMAVVDIWLNPAAPPLPLFIMLK